MRALEPEVANAVWEAVEGLIPSREVNHPMGGHRPRIPDRICFQGILIRLVTGWWWVSTEHLLGGAVSDTTLRARRDEWTEAGVFDAVVSEALAAYDRIIGLDLSDVSVDGSQHKAPCGGEGTGEKPLRPGQTGVQMVTRHRPGGYPRRLGHRRGQPATTASCSILPSRRWTPEVSFSTSRPCISTADMTATGSGTKPPPGASTTSSAPKNDQEAKRTTSRSRRQPPSVCDGPSSGPTHGSPTTGNYAATPTATPNTASPNSPSQSRS